MMMGRTYTAIGLKSLTQSLLYYLIQGYYTPEWVKIISRTLAYFAPTPFQRYTEVYSLSQETKVEILLFYSNALPLSRLAYCKKDNCQTALLPRSGTATKIFSWSCSSPNAKTVTVWGVDWAGPTTCLTQADNTWS